MLELQVLPTWVLGIELRSLGLHGKRLTDHVSLVPTASALQGDLEEVGGSGVVIEQTEMGKSEPCESLEPYGLQT